MTPAEVPGDVVASPASGEAQGLSVEGDLTHGDEEEDPQEGRSQGRTQGPSQGLAQEEVS